MPNFSIRWKIILLAGAVLGLTSALFILWQYQLQMREFEQGQEKFRGRVQLIVNQLLQTQTERMQMLGNLMVELPEVRQDLQSRQGDRLAQAVNAIATELTFAQGITSVVFHDADQNILAGWGDSAYTESLTPFARQAASSEVPQIRIVCNLSCVQQAVVPVNHKGHTIATISLVGNLESILNDLHRLSESDVALLHGKIQNEKLPVTDMRLVSVSGGETVREVLKAARRGYWEQGRFTLRHAGQVHQVVLLPVPMAQESHFAVISEVGGQIRQIESEAKRNLLHGTIVLVLAMLLLYLLLRPTMRRIQHVSRILPLLGEEKFSEVRENYATRPGGMASKDEVDQLETLALALAERLELLRNQSVRHAHALSQQAAELKHDRDFISGLLDTAPVLIVSHDINGRIQMANACAMQFCGVSDVQGEDYASLFQGEVDMSDIKPGQVCRVESKLIRKDGSVSEVLWFHSQVGEDVLSVGMDMTEHRKNEAKIHDLAFYDPLTRLPNRRMLEDYIVHAMHLSARSRSYCALVFIDMDHFKSINDSRGQVFGDQILVELAGRLCASVRETDTVAHLTGDEFVVLLAELSQDVTLAASQARGVVEKLRAAISAPFLQQGQSCHLTASMGITLFNGDEVAAGDLLRHANIAMSHAKSSGRNTLHFFDPAMQVGIEARASLETDLHEALAKQQFQLFYQIQVDSTGRAIGAEALLRWFHPRRGMVSPGYFIPLAEESVLILPIGLWVMETACAQIARWEGDAATCQLQLAVNVSARQFHQPDFVRQVLEILSVTGANPARLKLELTESLVLNDVQDTIEKMHQLKKHGVRFSMDDFGTAYSSLSYLTQLPVDQLKIDQSFVRNIGVKPSDAIIVQTIIDMAKNLGMEVIAEGVETQAQREFLEGADCLAYQGYLYSKPLELTSFIASLAGR